MTKFYHCLFLFITAIFSIQQVSAQTVVIPAPAPATMCITGGFTILGTIYIRETANTNFSSGNGQTYIMSLPANFQFNTGAVPIVVANAGSGISNIVVSTPTPTTFTFTYDASAASLTGIDSLIITNIQVQAVTAGSSGNLRRSGGTATQAGNAIANAQNHCSLLSASPVAITSQPINKSICATGSNVSIFDITATGAGLTYTWQRDNNNAGDGVGFDTINGALLTLYSNPIPSNLTDILPATAQNGFLFRCIVSSTCGGSVTSNVVTLSVANPVSTTDPTDQIICSGGTATFSVTGTNAVSYQWQENGSNISNTGIYSGTTSSALILTGVTTAMGKSGHNYRCIVTGACGTPVTSASKMLTVNAATAITIQPVNNSSCVGLNPTFSITATGSGALTYSWLRNRNDGAGFVVPPNPPYSGMNTPTITISNIQSSQNGYLFQCTVTGSCGTVISDTAQLIVYSLGSVNFFGINASYCRNAPIDTLDGFPTTGVFSGSGVTDLGNGKGIFNPLTAGAAGSKNIIYTLGCAVSKSANLIDTTTIAYTTPANTNPTYSTGDAPITLVVETSPTPTGPLSGTYTGTGVSSGKFYPSVAGSGGPYPVSFTFTNPGGCTSKVIKGISVTSPGLGIPSLRNRSPFCFNSTPVLLTDTCVDGVTPIWSSYYYFSGFSGTGISYNSATQEYQFSPDSVGTYVINYLVTYNFSGLFIYTFIYASESITVNAVTNIDLTGLPSLVCRTVGPITMIPTPGVLSGNAGTGISIFSPVAPVYPGILSGSDNTIFTPSIVPAGTTENFIVRYKYINVQGCTTILDKPIVVFPKPSPPSLSVLSAPANQEVCRGGTSRLWVLPSIVGTSYNWYDNSAPTLSTSNVLLPAASTATPSLTPYYVTQTSSGCTSDPLNLTFTVRDNANVNAGVDQSECVGLPFTLVGLSEKDYTNSPLAATWSGGLGAFNPDRNTMNAVYTPAASEIPAPGLLALKVKLKLISDYPDGPTGPCPVAIDSIVLNINPIPRIDELTVPKTAFCNSEVQFPLIPVYYSSYGKLSETYSDLPVTNTGISGTNFVPNIANPGPHTIKYTFTDINGCSNFKDTSIYIYKIPKPNIVTSSYCATAPTIFNGRTSGFLTVPNDNDNLSMINSYAWKFGDFNNGLKDTSTLDSTSYIFPKTLNPSAKQSYTVRLTVGTNKGCSNFKDSTITIGNIPATDFNWSGICPVDITTYKDLSNFPIAEVQNYTWRFGTEATASGSTLAYKDQTYKFLGGTGAYDVTFKIASKIGCIDSVTHIVNILDQYKPTPTDPYTKNFAVANGFWAVDGKNPSWQWGTTNKTNITTGTRKAWATDTILAYNVSEKSYLNGPCLNFGSLNRPMATLKIWSATQNQIAGAVLQSSIDGGATWNVIGDINSGINWYDNFGILGNPGPQPVNQFGWTGQYAGWKIAKVGLNSLSGALSVRLRLAFGSGQDTLNLKDGFAIDSIWVGNRDKLLLVENFTNSTSAAAASSDASLSTLVNRRSNDVVAINYHTGFPGTDQINLRNQANPSSRVLSYGVPSVPYKVFDGNYPFGSTLDTADVDRRSLDAAKFSIKLSTTINPGAVIVAANIIAKDSVKNNFVVQVAVLERHVTDPAAQGTNGQTDFEWVLARMLPDAAGTYFTQDFKKDDSAYVYQSWNYLSGEVYDPAQLGVLVFIQDITTKEVYQTAYVPGTGNSGGVVLGINDPADVLKVHVYPNPSSERSFVIFNKKITENFDWEIYDQLGKIVDNGKLRKGSEGFAINTSSYPAAMYVVKIGNGKDMLYTKLLVVH